MSQDKNYHDFSFDEALEYVLSPTWHSADRKTRDREQALRSLVPYTRAPLGRQYFASNGIQIYPALAHVFKDKFSCYEPTSVSALKILRNLCSSTNLPNDQIRVLNQKACLDHHVAENVMEVLSARLSDADTNLLKRLDGGQGAASGGRGDSSDSSARSAMWGEFYTYALQFLCNLTAENKIAADFVWDKMFPQTIIGLISCDDEGSVASVMALVHNCIVSNSERLGELLMEQMKVKRKKASVADHIVKNLNKSSSKQVYEWQHIFVRRIIDSGLLLRLFLSLSSNDIFVNSLAEMDEVVLDQIGNSILQGVSSPQIALLSCVDAALRREVDMQDSKSKSKNLIVPSCVPKDVVSFFQKLMSVYEIVKMDGQLMLMYQTTAQSLASILALKQDSRSKDDIKANIVAHTVVLLQNAQQDDSKEAVGMLTGLLQLIDQLCSGSSLVQNVIRESGGIPLILIPSANNLENAEVKKYAAAALKKLCENSDENRSMVITLAQQQPLIKSFLDSADVL